MTNKTLTFKLGWPVGYRIKDILFFQELFRFHA